jgi:PTH1 family peptidyl-tRNA hydrolase
MDNQFNLEKIRLVIGLGNIGREYIGTRHNVGFDILERLATTSKFVEEKKLKSFIYQGKLIDKGLIFSKPTTMMNGSGETAQLIASFFKIDPSEIIVVHDDLDLSTGSYKLQFGKGPKVHNGILSIENRLGTSGFWRLRIGVDSRDLQTRRVMSGADYVLGRFKVDEVKLINDVYEKIVRDLATNPQT